MTYDEYVRPHYELVIEAIENGEFVDGDIWESFLAWDELKIIENGFGNISQDNFDRDEIDRYYVFQVNDKCYMIWGYITMSTKDNYFPTQIAQEVKKTKRENDDWMFTIEEEE